MKTKWMMMAAMASAAMLMASEGWTWSPDVGSHVCKSEDFENNLKNAKYIVVARLEKYLPDNMGEYRVLMNLRGSVEVGAILHHSIIRRDGNKEVLGHPYIIFSELAEKKEQSIYTIEGSKCFGRVSAQTIECDLGYMCKTIKYLLEGKE